MKKKREVVSKGDPNVKVQKVEVHHRKGVSRDT